MLISELLENLKKINPKEVIKENVSEICTFCSINKKSQKLFMKKIKKVSKITEFHADFIAVEKIVKSFTEKIY